MFEEGEDWYEGINSVDDQMNSSPDSFRFHKTFKAIPRMLIRFVKTPQKWVDGLESNCAIIRDIYYEYLKVEKQEGRKTLLSAAIPFALCIAYYDPNYREVFEWFLYRIIQEQDKLKHYPQWCTPECWYQDGRGRGMLPDDVAKEVLEGKWDKL